MNIEDLKYLLFPLLFLNFIFVKRMDDKKLLRYNHLLKNIMILGWIYLIGVSMISSSNNNIYINIMHINLSLIGVLIVPIILLKLSEVTCIDITKIKLNLIKIFNRLYLLFIVFIVLFYFLNRDHYLNKYSFYTLFYLVFIYFLIHFKEK